MEKIKVFEAFAGYGSQAMALKRLNISFEVVGISEIDKYAIQAYMAVHGETPNFGDISKINWRQVPDFDLFTYSFPCTDISLAGKQKGFTKNSGTRSSLLWECERAIKEKLPKYLLMENVSAIISKKFNNSFIEWQNQLGRLGYSNFISVLNAKNFGIPQNRERVFLVSILDGWYNTPTTIPLQKTLADVLESEVDERYYLSEKLVKCFKERVKIRKSYEFKIKDIADIANTVVCRAGNYSTDNYIKQVGNLREPKILQRGRGFNSWHENNFLSTKSYIRKLTPRECFRLMGVTDSDIDKIQQTGLSNTQLYKMAGNSIVVAFSLKFLRKCCYRNKKKLYSDKKKLTRITN